MTVIILHNPRSGSGKAQRRADAAEHALADAGLPTARRIVGSGDPLTATDLADARCLVVVGGDGTVLRAAPLAMDAGCPIYHLPTGNENLFARCHQTTDRPADLVSAIRAANIAHASVGQLASRSTDATPAPQPPTGAQPAPEPTPPHPFLIMASTGPDAGVIRRLAAVRTRATGHAAYIRPVLAETFRPLVPRITLEADGRRITDARPGWLIVANARQYALRLDPVPDADPFDDRLDAVFIPAATSATAALALLRARARPRRWPRVRAAHLRVTVDALTPPCWQIDGELGPAAERTLTLELSLAPKPLKILQPA